MKYSVLLTAVLALVITACDKKDDVAMAPSDQVTPDQATPVTPAAPAAPVAEAPAPAAPEPQSAAPAASETSPAATESAAPAAAQGTALSLEEGHALGKKSGCFACHNIERKIIGPAWNDVGTKYKDNPAAHESLTKWVHTGGTGRWGTAVMPPYSPRVSDEDIEKLVDFILSLPKSS